MTTAELLLIAGLREDVLQFGVRHEADKVIRERLLRPAAAEPTNGCRAERAEGALGFRFWIIAAVPAFGCYEGRVLLAKDGGWVNLCAVGCQDRVTLAGPRRCPGHRMLDEDGRDFTEALIGHRTKRLSTATTVLVEGVDFLRGPYRIDQPAGSLHWRRCVTCGWRSARFADSAAAHRAGQRHEQTAATAITDAAP